MQGETAAAYCEVFFGGVARIGIEKCSEVDNRCGVARGVRGGFRLPTCYKLRYRIWGPVDAVGENVVRALLASGGGLPWKMQALSQGVVVENKVPDADAVKRAICNGAPLHCFWLRPHRVSPAFPP
mgnify:CR=1 FL=1